MTDKPKVLVEKTYQEPSKWRVYVWAERPDAELHVESDKHHWKLDSEHDTEAAAQAHAGKLSKAKLH